MRIESDLSLEPMQIRRSKLHELVSQKLEETIRSGGLKPGDQLPSERDIMEAYGIGRPAVREALLSLQNRGLITTESGRRARVMTPDVASVFSNLDGVVSMIISEKGKKLLEEMDTKEDAMDELLKNLNETDAKKLNHLLDKIRSSE